MKNTPQNRPKAPKSSVLLTRANSPYDTSNAFRGMKTSPPVTFGFYLIYLRHI